jgi:glutamyl-tRNA synthetase
MSVRVRFAPSPTGRLHIGSARTALYNWLFAKHEKGTFILRIEDTDRERSKKEYLQTILSDLTWLGLTWDEGPYCQSERLSFYQELAQQLLNKGNAYYCYCTPSELALKKEKAVLEKKPLRYDGSCRKLTSTQRSIYESEGRKPVLRLVCPENVHLTVHDAIRGEINFSTEVLDDFIIVKSDGFPVYNFACAADDHDLGITHVLRGEEHLSNTPRQLLIYRVFGWVPPIFGHLSIILDENRKKLSKREGSTFLDEFRESGFLPEALLNFLVLLGWASDENKEKMSLSEIVQKFTLNGVTKSPAIFDFKKLEWMNSQYIRELPVENFIKLAIPFLEKAGWAADGALKTILLSEDKKERLRSLVMLYRERVKRLNEFPVLTRYYFLEDIPLEFSTLKKWADSKGILFFEEFLKKIQDAFFTPEVLERTLRDFVDSKGLKAGDLIHPLRYFLTGQEVSPGVFEVMAVLGKERTLTRIQKGVLTLNQLKNPA